MRPISRPWRSRQLKSRKEALKRREASERERLQEESAPARMSSSEGAARRGTAAERAGISRAGTRLAPRVCSDGPCRYAAEPAHESYAPPRLATIKTLSGFDFAFQPSLDRNRILALAQLDFIDRHEVVHLIGQSGTGKSHLALALGVEAVRAGRSVYFSPLADIIDNLARADRESRLRERIRYLCRAQLPIIDEIGYLSLGAGAGNLFFQLVNARYERGAMILTSNRGFAEWGEVFGDPVVATALLDRLLHHAVVVHIEGSSYRLRQHADLLAQPRRPSQPTTEAPPRRRGRPPKATPRAG